MEIVISRRRRPSRRSTRLAFRSTVTATLTLVAAYIVQSRALPTIADKAGDLGRGTPASLSWLVGLQSWLMYMPLPGLILGFLAIAMPRRRPILSALAALATLAAVAGLVAILAGSLAPMYQLPEEFIQHR